MTLTRVFSIALLVLLASPATAIETSAKNVQAFVDRMVEEHGFDRAELLETLGRAERKDKILEAISRPAEGTLSWGEYRRIFLTEERIEAGVAFWQEHESELERIAGSSGVPIEIIVGIIGVETYYGRITGSYRVLDALTTLAFHYPRRSAFFTRELEQFLLLVRSEALDATEPTGSYAGAMGRPQFMPSSYMAYAVDSTGDGKRDIWNNWSDVAGSIANYFLKHQWRPGDQVAAQATLGEDFEGPIARPALKPSTTVAKLRERGVSFDTDLEDDDPGRLIELEGDGGAEHWVGFHNFFVITRYNRSVMYALAVHQLGLEIAAEVANNAG